MKAKKYMAMIAAGSVIVTSVAGGEVSMAAMERETVIEAAEETDMLREQVSNQKETVVIDSEKTEDTTEESTDLDEIKEKPEITDLKAEFNERKNQITLTWEMTANTYAKIYVNNELAEGECIRNAYVYDVPYEGMNYEFEVIPYMGEEHGESEKVSVSVGYKKAVLEDVDVEYDLDKKILSIEWNGESIKYADVYQDDVKIAEKVTDSRVVLEASLEPLSKHVYKVIPYNGNQEAGDEKTVELQVDDYTAKITEYDIEYDEENKKIVMEWDAVHTSGVVIYINEEEVEGEYQSDKYVLNYQLQSGAKYQVTIAPYNKNGEEGAAVTTTLQNGEFETPTIDDLQEKSIPVTDGKGNYTGFHKPIVEVIWEGEENGTYELYRAEKDKKSAYTYVATIKSSKDGVCTYTDKNVGVGDYYYKIRKVIKEDAYITQEIATSLSESMVIGIELPKPVLQAELAEDNMVMLTLDGKKDYVSGYEIYRKTANGKYKKIAIITENTYLDEKVDFETLYKYKARAYYYDNKTGKKEYGPYSKIVSAKNTLGNIKIKVTALSKNKVKISWNKVANAERYEVYYKSDVQGDGYTLLKNTKKLSFIQKLESGKEYSFLIKAYRKKETGETYFSSDEVTYETGFSKPKGFKIEKTEYELKKGSNTLIQKDTLSWKQVYGAKGYYIEVYNETTKNMKPLQKLRKQQRQNIPWKM